MLFSCNFSLTALIQVQGRYLDSALKKLSCYLLCQFVALFAQIFYPDEEGTGGEWWLGEIVTEREEHIASLSGAGQPELRDFVKMNLWERFRIQWNHPASTFKSRS